MLKSRTIRVALVVIALVLITREAIDFASYPQSKAPQFSISPEGAANNGGGAAAFQQPLMVQPVSAGSGGAPAAGRARHSANSAGGFPETSGAAAVPIPRPVEPSACSSQASDSQIAKLLAQVARLKVDHPELEPALIQLEAELSRSTGGRACMENIQQTMKVLCSNHPSVKQALESIREGLPVLARFVARDPCNEDLGSFLNIIDRLNPDL